MPPIPASMRQRSASSSKVSKKARLPFTRLEQAAHVKTVTKFHRECHTKCQRLTDTSPEGRTQGTTKQLCVFDRTCNLGVSRGVMRWWDFPMMQNARKLQTIRGSMWLARSASGLPLSAEEHISRAKGTSRMRNCEQL